MDHDKELVRLIKLALEGRDEDFKAYARKTIASISKRRPDLSELSSELGKELISSPNRASKIIEPLPVDLDSRQELVRRDSIIQLPNHITWPSEIGQSLNEIVEERLQDRKLIQAGLAPVRTVLFIGQPGVGKTLAAQWIANKISRQLLTLDLSSVMSSYLGKTGNNIRAVLDFAKRSPSVLLLDEFDSIAKRRDDSAEVGELKRLVTVLLQSIDDWPLDGLLIAATNHPELLDPAVWRRFDRIIEFPKPHLEVRKAFITKILNETLSENKSHFETIDLLSTLTEGQSFADIKRDLERVKKQSLISNRSVSECLHELIAGNFEGKTTKDKLRWAKSLTKEGLSQHRINEITGLSRDTIRKHVPTKKKNKSKENQGRI